MPTPALERWGRSPLERTEAWASLPADARKRRAAEAVRDDDRPALLSLLEAHTRTYGRRGLRTSELTVATYRRGARRLLAWCAENACKPHALDGLQARRFASWLLASGLSEKSAATYVTGARALVAALRWAGLGEGAPLEGAAITEPTHARDKARPYSPDELSRLLEAANARERALVLLAADGGLRLAEVAGLHWRAVDLSERSLSVMGKGGKRRSLRLTRRLCVALAALPQTGAAVLGVSRRRLQQLLDALCRRASVKPRGLHNLRHSCGTRMYGATHDLLSVSRHLGHRSIETSRLYAHLADGDYLAAVDALEAD